MTISRHPDDSGFKHSSQPGWFLSTRLRAHATQALATPAATAAPSRMPQAPCMSTDAHVWLARIPPRYQPLATARRHPHVINRLCELWPQPQQVAAYLQELMLSQRPQREGFLFEVLTELADLQTLLDQGEHAKH